MCRLAVFSLIVVPLSVAALAADVWAAGPLVPGTGEKIAQVGDDFEDPAWKYRFNLPKSSKNIDEQVRGPTGGSANGRWFESMLRGQPDQIERVETPEDGLPGSTGSLLIRSLQTGVPKRPSRQNQQDDLLLNVAQRAGGKISVSRSPSFTVRVWLPPYEQWEQRSGNSFAVRAAVWGRKGRGGKSEEYWPGIFIKYTRSDPKTKQPGASLVIRGNQLGHDFETKKVGELGWWTFGMSFTPDGQVHYFGSPGVDELTDADRLYSQWPYGFRAETFQTFFFNVVNSDDGRTWSTPWIVDDPAVYVLRQR